MGLSITDGPKSPPEASVASRNEPASHGREMTKSFTGRDGLDIIPFLTRLRAVSDEAGLSEGVVLRLLPDLLLEPALPAFRRTHPVSYPVALRWFY
jgi:hypothetical protein